MFMITKELQAFSAAHRLVKGYHGKCQHLHGHDYALEMTLAAEQLDHYDFVMDFDVIKANFNQWVQDHWDHGTLVSDADQPLLMFLQKERQKHYVITGQKNTTVECLAAFLFEKFTHILDALNTKNKVQLVSLRLYESKTASATITVN